MADDEQPKEPDRRVREAIELETYQRVLLGFVGALLLGVSCEVLISATDGIGTALLVVVGALLAFFSIVGVLPTRIGMGDNSLDFWRREAISSQKELAVTTDELQDAIEVMTPQQVEEARKLASALHTASPSESLSSIAQSTGLSRERVRQSRLRAISEFTVSARANLELACRIVDAQARFDVLIKGFRWDAIVRLEGTDLCVDLRYSITISKLEELHAVAPPEAQVLVIHGQRPTNESLRYAEAIGIGTVENEANMIAQQLEFLAVARTRRGSLGN